ncbi:hypothetical protein F4818DRAFT_67315 [Hypoxylon cercidicola]|nr:hypothetical protein F4818DRAFT_67315 [Hypoxylon cercidicola]
MTLIRPCYRLLKHVHLRSMVPSMCKRFICKSITPQDLQNGETSLSQTTANSPVSLNSAICPQVNAKSHSYGERLSLGETVTGAVCQVMGTGLYAWTCFLPGRHLTKCLEQSSTWHITRSPSCVIRTCLRRESIVG